MSEVDTIEDTIEFAQKVLDDKPLRPCKVMHNHNYFNKKILRPNFKERTEEDESKEHIILRGPGQALGVELKLLPPDPRVGNFPQHNSPGPFNTRLEVIPSLVLDDFQDIHTVECLEKAGYVHRVSMLTKKRLDKIAHQFANLSQRCFKDMMCLYGKQAKRDFDIWIKYPENTEEWVTIGDRELPAHQEIKVAYINPHLELIQFIQCMTYDTEGTLVDIKHVVFEAGIPLVVNQSTYDKYGNLRNIAHVGVTGSASNSFENSLERFDDGTVLWTTSDFKNGRNLTGSAALKENGQVILLNEGCQTMSHFSARNLGAEGINPRSLAWTGKYSRDACIPEKDDKYIVRREYKNAVRKQVYQIIDGACIPGPDPIFVV